MKKASILVLVLTFIAGMLVQYCICDFTKSTADNKTVEEISSVVNTTDAYSQLECIVLPEVVITATPIIYNEQSKLSTIDNRTIIKQENSAVMYIVNKDKGKVLQNNIYYYKYFKDLINKNLNIYDNSEIKYIYLPNNFKNFTYYLKNLKYVIYTGIKPRARSPGNRRSLEEIIIFSI